MTSACVKLGEYIQSIPLTMIIHPHIEASNMIACLIDSKSIRSSGLFCFHHDDLRRVNEILDTDYTDNFISTQEIIECEEKGLIVVTSKFDEIKHHAKDLFLKEIKIVILSQKDFSVEEFEVEKLSFGLTFVLNKITAMPCLETEINRKLYNMFHKMIVYEDCGHAVFCESEKIKEEVRAMSDELKLQMSITSIDSLPDRITESVIHFLDVPSSDLFETVKSRSPCVCEYAFYLFYREEGNEITATSEVLEYNLLAEKFNTRKVNKSKRIVFGSEEVDLVVIM